MTLYGSVLPSYSKKDSDKGSAGKEQEVVKADDPNNKERVREFLEQIE